MKQGRAGIVRVWGYVVRLRMGKGRRGEGSGRVGEGVDEGL